MKRFQMMACGAVLAILAAQPASAQVFDMGALTNSLSQGALIQSEAVRANNQRVFRSLPRASRSGTVNRAAILYRPSMAVRQRNMRQFVARLSRVDPKSAADMQRTFARRDVVAEIAGAMRPVGLNPNNVADAMAMYLVAAYYGVRGSVDSKPADYRVVSAQMARAISTTPGFANASDALKQEIAESMLVQALLVDQAIQAAQKQPSAMPSVKAAIAKGARGAFGFDVTRMRLGPNGLT